MLEVVEGVYTFTGLGVGRVYLLEGRDGWSLIDTSLRSSGKKILSQLASAAIEPQEIRRILVTHAHPDHAGSLAELVRACGAAVLASEAEAPVLAGDVPIPRPPKSSLRGIARWLPVPDTTLRGPGPTRILRDGEMLPEILDTIHVVATPGHAAGHLAFFEPQRRILFCGDVLFNLFDRITLPWTFFTVDMEENRRSIERVLDLEPDVVCFGHGPPIVGDAMKRLRAADVLSHQTP